jgi:hypothetical protein
MSRGLILFFTRYWLVCGLVATVHAAEAPVAEELAVSLDHGALEVINVPGTNVTVEVFRLVEGWATRMEGTAADAKLRYEDGVLVLKLSSRGRSGMLFQVGVPPSWALNLKNSNGAITVTNHAGALKAKSSVGKIQLGRIRGDIDAQSSNGDVWLERGDSAVRVKTSGGKMTLGDIRGLAVLEASGGSIQLQQARGELIAKAGGGSINVLRAHDTVRAQTSGGSIAINFTAQPKNECVLRTSGGSVVLGLAPQLNLRLAARGEGDVNTDLPIDWKDTHERYQRGLLNTNGGTITARAEGGQVTMLAFSEQAAPVENVFRIRALTAEAGAQSKPMVLVPPPALPVRRVAKVAARDVPRIERDERTWQDADWRPVVYIPKGLRLRDGQWIEAEVTALSDFSVKFRRAGGLEESAKLNQVAAILLQPVPDTRRERIEASQRGVLLRGGDFFEGEFSRLDMGQATLSSVLFGLKKFNLKTEVSALVFQGE